MEPRTKEVRDQEKRMFVEHNLKIEEILFRAIVTLTEEKTVLTATDITALAAATEALVEVQRRIV